METLLTAEKVIGFDFLDRSDEEGFEEISFRVSDLGNLEVEMEKEKFINLRRQAAMLMHVIDSQTVIEYPSVVRTKFEVRNGYKQALLRGANLGETEVFNLLFRFRGRLRGDGVALMCHGPTGEEWIMLCPDDTAARIQHESKWYMQSATTLTLQGRMRSEEQNRLLENLRTLTIGTRCENSLQHEFGHVIQHRLWAAEGIRPDDLFALYKWFLEIGYADLVSLRYPNFENRTDAEKLYLLKESFVEDYRIGLNLSYRKDIFELPNAYCFRADFQMPELLDKGVSLVKAVVKGKVEARPTVYEDTCEPDRVALIHQIMAESSDFDARQAKPMSTDAHQAVLDRLRARKITSN
ncbi:MAG: hypothetical protein ACXVP2_09115 [Tumebacillaceae bacterium]